MSDDIVHRRMPKPRKVTICIVLMMAFSNSVTLIITLIRPVPQFATAGVLVQLGARTEATLAKRHITMTDVVMDYPGYKWSPPLELERATLESGWPAFVDPLEGSSRVDNVIKLPVGETNALPSSLVGHTLQARSSCGDPCGDEFFDGLDGKPKPPKSKSKPLKQKLVDPKAYIDMVVGLLGVCIMRVDGGMACSKPSFNPDYKAVFQQANLDNDVIEKLPHSPGISAILIVFSAALYCISVIIFSLMLIPPFSIGAARKQKRSMDPRHQRALAVVAVVITVALMLAMIPTFTLRNIFLKAINAIPAYNENLQARLGTAFTQLYAVCILGGLILFQCLLLISEDLRYPWWFTQASIRRNPFETTEPGITLTADSLKQERLDRRFDELKKPPEFTIPDFQAMHEASARRWEERQAAAMQEALSNLHQGAGTGHATSPVTGNV